MQKHEGIELRNKIKGTGRTMGEVAQILGMTRQNLSYHLRKTPLEPDFKRLFQEKSKFIFHVEQFAAGGEAGGYVGNVWEDIVSLRGEMETVISRVLELYAASKGSSYATAETDFLKDAKDATDRLFDELQKKLKQGAL